MRFLLAVLLAISWSLPLSAQRTCRATDTIATLKAMVPSTATPETMVCGRFSIADGSGGMYHWDATSAAEADDFNVVISTVTATGRHLRCFVISSSPPAQTVSTPYFTPAAGTYSSPQSVTIATTTPGATIYYTTDGSDPTTNSTAYTTTVSISSDTILKAFATKSGLIDSPVVSGAYVITTAVAGPVFHFTFQSSGLTATSPQQYLWSDEIGFPLVIEFSITSATPGAEIFWVSGVDTATDPDDSDPLYSVPGSFSTSTQFKAIAKSGGVYSTVTTAYFAIELPVLWGYSPNTTITGPQARALQNEDLIFFWDQRIPVFTYFTPHGSYTFDSGSTVNDYFYWAWPVSMPSPAAVNGFFLPPFPLPMATGSEGFTDGPENGWSYLTTEVDTGINYKVYRSFNQIGGGGSLTITVQ